MNTHAKRAIALCVAAACFAAVVCSQMGVDRHRAAMRGDTLLYLPNEKLLNHFTAGLSSIVADFVWLECVQYVGKQVKGDRDFTWLNQMLNTVVRLDPYFADAYRYGGMFLATLRADDDAGLDLIERGIVQRPDKWELPYEAAMIFLLNRKDKPDSPKKAAYFLAMSAAHPDAPPLMRDIATALQSKYNLNDIERDMWTRLKNGNDSLLRDMADRKLKELDCRQICALLDTRIAAFKQRHNRIPKDLQELVQDGALKAVPPNPLGTGEFIIDAAGKAQQTAILEDQKTQALSKIRGGLDAYKKKFNQYPPNLDTMTQMGVMSEIPPNPYAGQEWQYDPASGSVG